MVSNKKIVVRNHGTWVMYERAGLGCDAGGGARGRMDNLRSGGDIIEDGGVGGKKELRR